MGSVRTSVATVVVAITTSVVVGCKDGITVQGCKLHKRFAVCGGEVLVINIFEVLAASILLALATVLRGKSPENDDELYLHYYYYCN